MDYINLSSTAATLLITLYSRAAMSKNNMIMKDEKAEEIISIAGYDERKLKVSKKLQALLTLRAHIMDEYTKKFIEKYNGECTIIQLGCGLDSRYLRMDDKRIKWYDVDFYGTIEMRKKYYKNSINYKMIASNVCNFAWLDQIEDKAIIAEKKVENISLTEMLKLQEAIEEACGVKRNQLQDIIRLAQQNSI